MIVPVSAQCLWTLLDTASDVLVVVASDQSIAYLNQRATKLLGFTREEAVGQPASLVFVAAQAGQFIAGLGKCDCDRTEQRRTVLLRRRDGVILPARVCVRTLQMDKTCATPAGQAAEMWAVVIRQDEELFARSQARCQTEGLFRTLVDTISDYGIFMLDRQGRVITWNQGAQMLSGRAAEVAVERSFASLFGPDPVKGEGMGDDPASPNRGAAGLLDRARRDGKVEATLAANRACGRPIALRILIAAIRDRGDQVIGFSVVMHDRVDGPSPVPLSAVASLAAGSGMTA